MKRFLVFLVIFIILAAGITVFTSIYLDLNPKKIVIAVDSSYNMNNYWTRLTEIVKSYESARYSTFTLITDKMTVHSWDTELKTYKLGSIKPYGPQDITVFLDDRRYPELKKAAQIIIITDAEDTSMFNKDSRYKIIQMK